MGQVKTFFLDRILSNLSCRQLSKHSTTIVVFCFFLLSFLSFYNLLLNKGVIGFHHDWDVPPYLEYWRLLYPLSSFLSSKRFLYDLVLYLSSILGLQSDFFSKAYPFFFLALSGISMFYLCKTIELSIVPSFVSGIFYMLSPVMFWRLSAGHLPFVSGYALSPLIISIYLKNLKRNKISYPNLIVVGLLLSFASSQIHILGMLLPILFLSSFLVQSKKRHVVFSLLFVSVIFIAINASWILPELLPESEEIPKTILAMGKISVLSEEALRKFSPTLIDALSLFSGPGLSRYYEWSMMSLGITKIYWFTAILVLAVVCFSTIIIKPKDKRVIFATTIALVSIFLTKGANEPFGCSFIWFLQQVPLAQAFRETYKFAFITALAYAILLGIICNEMIKNGKVAHFRITRSYVFVRAKSLAFLLILLLILFQALPFFTGNLGGPATGMQLYELKPEYRELYLRFLNDKSDSKILWIPMLSPIQYENLSSGPDPLIGNSPKPTLMGKSSEERFLALTLHQNRTRYLSSTLLDYFNVKYIILRNDFQSMYPYYVHMMRYPTLKSAWTNEQASYVLQHQQGIKVIENKSNYVIFQNDNLSSLIYASDRAILATNGLSNIVSVSYAEEVLKQNASRELFFASQFSQDDNVPTELFDTIMISGDTLFDLLSIFIPYSFQIDPGDFATINYDANKGWINAKDWWWYSWYYGGALENGALTLTKDTLQIPLALKESDEYTLLVKTFFGDKFLSLAFSIDSRKIGEITTPTGSGFSWVNLGNIHLEKGRHLLEIESTNDGENYVGRVIIVPTQALNDALNRLNDLILKKNLIILYEMESPSTLREHPTGFNLNASHGLYYTTSFKEALEKLKANRIVNACDSTSGWSLSGGYGLTIDNQERVEGSASVSGYFDASKNNLLEYRPAEPTIWNLNEDLSFQFKTNVEVSGIRFYVFDSNGRNRYWNVGPISTTWSKYVLSPNNYAGTDPDFSLGQISRIRVRYDPGKSGSIKFNMDRIAFETYERVVNFKRKVNIPAEGDYKLYVRASEGLSFDYVRLNNAAGEKEIAIVVSKQLLGSTFQWYNVGTLHLLQGTWSINFESPPEVDYDLMILQSVSRLSDQSAISMSYEYGYDNYRITVNSPKPFFLFFKKEALYLNPVGESYATWHALINGEPLTQYTLNSFIRAFIVNKTGSFQITLASQKNLLVVVAQDISILSLISSLVCVMATVVWKKLKWYTWPKKKSMALTKLS